MLDWATARTADSASDWATAAEVGDVFEADVEPALHLGGPGAPVVGEYAALGLALSLGGSSESGLAYLGRALELRLPLPWSDLHGRRDLGSL